jgi:hypothetical protein
MEIFNESLARVRWPRSRDAANRRSARRIAMQARREQERELGRRPDRAEPDA